MKTSASPLTRDTGLTVPLLPNQSPHLSVQPPKSLLTPPPPFIPKYTNSGTHHPSPGVEPWTQLKTLSLVSPRWQPTIFTLQTPVVTSQPPHCPLCSFTKPRVRVTWILRFRTSASFPTPPLSLGSSYPSLQNALFLPRRLSFTVVQFRCHLLSWSVPLYPRGGSVAPSAEPRGTLSEPLLQHPSDSYWSFLFWCPYCLY